ncbi:uncharacterized protein LOC143819731 [Paroedura picta]|uniref:uncharacterized protein LOC143819731 n=1 Tax=Paroedura picta TaxID=143630 RepID=UPI0040564EC9
MRVPMLGHSLEFSFRTAALFHEQGLLRRWNATSWTVPGDSEQRWTMFSVSEIHPERNKVQKNTNPVKALPFKKDIVKMEHGQRRAVKTKHYEEKLKELGMFRLERR